VSQADTIVLVAVAAKAAIDELADVLIDCVDGGASVSFMLPFGRDDAKEFFEKIIASVARGETVLVAARLDGRIVGTVQLGLDMPPNQPHRGDIKKLLVHRAARNHGLGAALMARAEQEAKARNRSLLVLDTAGSESERLYVRTGWQRVGVVPDYAMWPQGGFCDTIFFGRRFKPPVPARLPSQASRACASGPSDTR
jgi:GNAT superfamily N-acetyltransferase